MWHKGIIGSYTYEVKSYDEPSRFGIDGGRVSKLWLATRVGYTPVAVYDRGWDRLPAADDDEARAAVDAILELWN